MIVSFTMNEKDFTRIGKSMMKRYNGNPIFKPEDFPFGTADQVFNPGIAQMPDGRTILLLSVLFANQEYAKCYVAESTDGLHFTVHEKPLFSVDQDKKFGDLDFHPIDCRVTRFDEDGCFYIIRPANSGWGVCALLYKTTDFINVEPIEVVALPQNRVPCLFPEKINGKYYRLDRPYSPGAPYAKSCANIWVSASPDLIYWGEHRPLLKRAFMPWNGLKVGPTVPVKTSKGWLEIIHGVQECFASWRYSLGAVLLDLNDPTKIIGRMNRFILTPEMDYERNGVIPNVVFATGCILDKESNLLRIYYGGSDTTTNLAVCDVDELVDGCLKGI